MVTRPVLQEGCRKAKTVTFSLRGLVLPIQDLLHRIRWDAAFGSGAFEVGYVDRVAGGVVRVPLRDVRVEHGQLIVENLFEEDGSPAAIPLHRVREVWRDGRLIWQRAPLRT